MSFENATLYLRSIDGVSTNANAKEVIWSNISLRTLLGDMWDKYDEFKLVPKSIISRTITAVTSQYITIEGLPFLNNRYDTNTKQITNEIPMACVRLGTTVSYHRLNNHGLVFNKNQHLVNITIRRRDTAGALSGQLAQVGYLFGIVGINKGVKISRQLGYDNMANLTLRTVNCVRKSALFDEFTWALDLRQVMGDTLYYGYDRFKLIINSYSPPAGYTLAGGTTNAQYNCLMVLVKGLAFNNSTYNTVQRVNTDTAVLGDINISTSAYANNCVHQYDSELGVCFSRSHNQNVELTLSYQNLLTNQPFTYADCMFYLSICGIDDFQKEE